MFFTEIDETADTVPDPVVSFIRILAEIEGFGPDGQRDPNYTAIGALEVCFRRWRWQQAAN